MSGPEELLAPRRWRAPADDAAALVDPPLDSAGDVLRGNRERLRTSPASLGGRPLAEMARAAQRELFRLAREYTSAYRDLGGLTDLEDSASILLAGHQPHLAHPGVWFKTFVLSSLGRELSTCPINLLIDNDTLRAPSIRVPTGSPGLPQVESVPFDAPSSEIPYEERDVLDPICFDAFGARAADVIGPLVPDPLVNDLWPWAKEAARRNGNLGRSLAEARHRLEESLGLATLEVPLSHVCETQSFRWFTAGLLADLPRLQGVYNSSLAEFRRVNRIRSRSHPVPDLVENDGAFEAPFWIWTREHPRRRHLFVQSHTGRLELSDRAGLSFDLPLANDGGLDDAVEQLAAVSARGVKIRPRALLTTMYARLILCDLFVHGIGGSKYDQLTDTIIARFFDVEPPAFLTATATLRLPVERPGGTVEELRRLDASLREIRFHPERFLQSSRHTPCAVSHGTRSVPATLDSDAQPWIVQKNRWLAEHDPRQRKLRHQGIEAANRALASLVDEQRQELLGQRHDLAARLRAAAVLGSREYSFCLYPRESLVETLQKLSVGNSLRGVP